MRRGGRNQHTWEPKLIDTPCGPMTRREASILSGVPFNTIHRRIWDGCPVEWLFVKRVPRGTFLKRHPAYANAGPKRRYERERANDYVETWEARKARRASEKITADRTY